MKKMCLLSISIFLNTILAYSQCKADSAWQYLGQKPPGLTPEVFAPGIISGKDRLHCFPSFSSDGKEIVWMTLPPKLHSVTYDTAWSQPTELPFSEQYTCLFPVHGNNSNQLYFSSFNIPNGLGGLDIWCVEKTDTGYSTPKNMGSPINTSSLENQPSFASSGNLYFTGTVPGKRWNRGILFSIVENGSYSTPEVLSETINISDTNAIDYTPYIAKDESFLLFCSNRLNPEKEDCRIFVSFKEDNGEWGNPINLNDIIEFDADSRNPYISPDGKYLFFCSGENIYWMSSMIIDAVKMDFQ